LYAIAARLGIAQGHDLGMGFSGSLGVALTQQLALH
jgi:hypothetical protein